ncbi:hypothetical protein AN958_11222 [Leucoagaricus sp. SymC.cos]|nr:hypothetical protein AN958_11222 [Leucoagaricus sp. SymC.cos]
MLRSFFYTLYSHLLFRIVVSRSHFSARAQQKSIATSKKKDAKPYEDMDSGESGGPVRPSRFRRKAASFSDSSSDEGDNEPLLKKHHVDEQQAKENRYPLRNGKK